MTNNILKTELESIVNRAYYFVDKDTSFGEIRYTVEQSQYALNCYEFLRFLLLHFDELNKTTTVVGEDEDDDREYTSLDINDNYFNIAKKRIEES